MTDAERFSRKMDRAGPPLKGAALFGSAVLLVFFGSLGAWGAFTPLESAAIARGVVSVDTNRKTIQHLEGGIIKAIRVREGQKVRAGQVLVELDQTKARSKIGLLEATIKSELTRLKYINEEIVDVESLLKKGLVAKPRVLELYRRKAELIGKVAQHREELRAARDVVVRSKIRAPLAGTVVGLKVHTVGGVIKPGDAILTVVPSDEPLYVEARLDPNDIDVVTKGLKAQVRLTPYGARHFLPLEGQVAWVSADRLSDEKSGASYYLLRVELKKKPSELTHGQLLYPGMPAEVMILTGSRTPFDYLAEPIVTSFRRAFREKD